MYCGQGSGFGSAITITRIPESALPSVKVNLLSHTRIEIVVPVRLLQPRKCPAHLQYPCPGANPLHFPLRLQILHQRINRFHTGVVTRCNPPENTTSSPRIEISFLRRFQNRLEACVRAPVHYQQSIRSFDRKGQFWQLECPRVLRDCPHEENTWRHPRIVDSQAQNSRWHRACLS